MTQEEKAKAYDEALCKAEEMLENSCSSETTKAVCKEIFPELAESEDERVRKEIIRIVDIWTGSSPVVNGIPREILLAYLEKQKENEK